MWHWAHQSRDECDPWAERDTEWHREWQAVAPIERREVVIGNHRADVVTANGTVVELQHSYLAPDEISERERHYGPRMVWLFDARDAYDRDRFLPRRRREFDTFRWKHPRKSIAVCRRPVIPDLGYDRLFLVKKVHSTAPCGGWGHLRPRSFLVDFINAPALGGAA